MENLSKLLEDKEVKTAQAYYRSGANTADLGGKIAKWVQEGEKVPEYEGHEDDYKNKTTLATW